MPLIYLAALFIFAVCVLIWNDPSKLIAWADRIDTYGTAFIRWIVLELRIRAAAKHDSQRAYRRAQIWYRRVL